MVLLFYVDDFLMFSPSKDTIYDIYDYIHADLNIEYHGELNKHLGIELDRCPDCSIHPMQNYLNQRIINIISGMER